MKQFILCLLLLFPLTAAAQDKVLNIYAWSGEIPDFAIKAFEKKTGIKVNFSTFENNEMMYAKLRADENGAYDIVLPSSYFVDRMRKQNMLHQLDKSKLPNWKNLNPEFLNAAYDPGSNYAVPHVWGVTGIFISDHYYNPKKIRHWSQLWEKQFYNHLMLLDDMREVFSMALISLGYPVNDRNPEHLKDAFDKLKILMKNVKVFASDTSTSIIIDEDAPIGMAWNGDTYKAKMENPAIQFVLPEEGFTIWVDTFAILKNAPHKEAAYQFINYMLDAEVNKQIAMTTNFPTANLAAKKLLPPAIRNNPIIYPSESTMRRGQFQTDLDQKTIEIYEQYWEALKMGA